MTRKADQISANLQGRATSHVGMADLYETRHGLFGGSVRTLWEGGAANDQGTAGASGAQGSSQGEGNAGEQIARSLQNLINRNGGADRTAELLFSENREHRARIRELEGQLPAAGTRVLTAEQAAQFDAYQQLGPDPAALRTRLEQGSQAVEREQGRELAEAAQADSTVLMDRLRVAGLRAEVREVPGQNGAATTRTVHVLDAEGQDQGELRAYATQHWAAYVPALFPQAAGQGTGTPVTGQAGAGTASSAPATNPITAALQGSRPVTGGSVVSAFDFSPSQPTGGNP